MPTAARGLQRNRADGQVDSPRLNPTHTFTEEGLYRATLTVTDQTGRSSSDYVEIIVGQRPVVRVTPTAGQPFPFGDTVRFEVVVG